MGDPGQPVRPRGGVRGPGSANSVRVDSGSGRYNATPAQHDVSTEGRRTVTLM